MTIRRITTILAFYIYLIICSYLDFDLDHSETTDFGRQRFNRKSRKPMRREKESNNRINGTSLGDSLTRGLEMKRARIIGLGHKPIKRRTQTQDVTVSNLGITARPHPNCYNK